MKHRAQFKTVRMNSMGTRYLKSMDIQERIFQPLISAAYPVTGYNQSKTISRLWSFGKPIGVK